VSAGRLVVACRLAGALCFDVDPSETLARFALLVERAGVLGGALVASSYDGVVFAWADAQIQEAVGLATAVTHAGPGAPAIWACGVACGDLVVGKPPAPGSSPLCWGDSIALASALARIARLGEVLVHASVPALASNDLLTNRARMAHVGGRRIRGMRVDPRQAWRALAAADVARMVDPPLIGRDAEVARLMAATDVIILRADGGFGGSRVLAEVAARTRPSRSILLTPLAPVHEPLGALRRAMAFIAATERIIIPANLHSALDRLLGAEGITVDEAAALIAHQVRRRTGAPVPSILLDDVSDLDAPSVDACSRAVELLGHAVRVVARIDSMSQLPRCLARFCEGDEVSLGRFDAETAQQLAGACTGDALAPKARLQWARRGGGTPLGIVEAVAAGIAQGDLLWSGDTLARRRRTAGDDIARPVAYWTARRAEGLRVSSRDVLMALAHLGGEASVSELFDVVTAVVPDIDLQAETLLLRRGRWIREAQPGTFVLATRTQREAILQFSRNLDVRDWSMAVAKTLERASGALRRAEAAEHAARAGLGEWASRLATVSARASAQVGLEQSAAALTAFAEEQGRVSSAHVPASVQIDQDTTEVASLDAVLTLEGLDVDVEVPPPSLDVDTERPVRSAPPIDGLDPPFAPAPAPAPSVSYHGLLDGARDLRETRWVELARRSLIDGTGPDKQRRGLLALARAYAAEGRSHEALLHGLGALARMRQAGDRAGAKTCLLLLARIYEQTDRRPEAVTLKRAARSVASSAPPRRP
jgi:hypothetical protein